MEQSTLERAFETHWQQFGNGTPYQREYRFASPRRWRFDVAFPLEKVAVELNGGNWTSGRHSTGVGLTQDAVDEVQP